MYKCRKCKGSAMVMNMNNKGTNTGLYCEHCGAWQKWLSKDEIRAAKFNKTVKIISGNSSNKIDTSPSSSNALFTNNLFEENDSPFDTEVKVNKDVKCSNSNKDKEEVVNIEMPLYLVKELMNILQKHTE